MPSLHRQRLLSTALAAAFGTTFAALGHQAFAQATTQAANQVVEVNVPAQSLSSALNELSRQTGVRVFGAGDAISNVNSRAVKGNLTPEQALKHMLEGTSLQATKTADGGFAINRGAVISSESPSGSLPTVTVKAARETATGPVNGYAARRTATATKTDVALIEVPQSITVVGAEEIKTLQAQRIQDALSYVAGVSSYESTNRTGDSLILRGFQLNTGNANLYRDGTRYGLNSFNGTQEPYGLERLEFLKGAASVLFGAAAPGGVINAVSKRPSTTPIRELNLQVGSFNRKQVSGDFSDAIDADGQWSYRLTFLKRDSDTFVDYQKDNRVYVAPALKWQPNAGTSLTLLAEYQDDKTGYTPQLPAKGTVVPNPLGSLPRERFLGEPGYDHYDNTRYTVGYLFEHAFNDKLSLRHNLRYYHQKSDFSYIGVVGSVLNSDNQTINRIGVGRNEKTSMKTTDTALQYKWGSQNFEHTSVVGVDYLEGDFETVRYSQSVTPGSFNVFNPVYGATLGPRTPNYFSSGLSESRQAGLYVQDHMKIAQKWVVLVGARQDWLHESTVATYFPVTTNDKNDALTGRAGIVYLADNGLAPFFNFSQSFEFTGGLDRQRNRFKPTEGEQYELGVRYQPKDSDLSLSASVYQLTKTNVKVSVLDPVTAEIYNSQIGEVRSRGLELEGRGRIGTNTNLIAAYTYTDARTTEAGPRSPTEQGRRLNNVPFNQLSLWADHSFGGLGIPGLKAGAGLRFVDSSPSPAPVVVDSPSYTVVDAMVSYATGPWQFALNVTNLTDKDYVAVCGGGCFYGEPRKVILTAGVRW